MNTKKTFIDTTRNKMFSILRKEIGGRDVCLLDLPNYYNPGDQLIWEGEEQILKQLNIKVKYRASHFYFNEKMISNNDCIILHGGGNFGDIYEQHQKFKEAIIRKFPQNKIIICSSTVHFTYKDNLRKSAKLFSKHPNVIIFARDKKSFRILQDNFKNAKCYLMPDMAFGIKKIKKISHKSKDKQILFHFRTDNEKSCLHKDSLDFINYLYISDWKPYCQKSFKGNIHWWITNINKVLLRLLKLRTHWNEKHDVYGMIKLHSKEAQIDAAVNFFQHYNLIITNRLHGHILACLLGIPNIVLDNNYGKNKSFFETWMKKNTFNAYYANSTTDVYKIMKKHFPEYIK